MLTYLSDIEKSLEFSKLTPSDQETVRKNYREEYGYPDIWDSISSSDEFDLLDDEDKFTVASNFDDEYGGTFGKSFINKRYAEKVGERGLLGDIGSRLARGAGKSAEQIGRALQVSDVSYEEDTGLLDRIGKGVQEFAEDLPQKYDIFKPDISEVEGGESWLKRKAMEGVEAIPLSLSPFVAGAAGALAGGPILGGAAGLGTLGAMFFGGTYHEEMDKYKDVEGLTYDEKNKAALTKAGIEFGGEMVSDVILLGIGKAIPGASGVTKEAAKEGIKKIISLGPKEVGKVFGKTYAAEWGTETAQAKLQSDVDNKLGLGEQMSIIEAATETAVPTAVMTLAFGLGAGAYNANQKRKVLNSLNSGNPEERSQAVSAIYNNLRTEDPEVAKAWGEYAGSAVAEGKAIDVKENFVNQIKVKPTPADILKTDNAGDAIKVFEESVKADPVIQDPIKVDPDPVVIEPQVEELGKAQSIEEAYDLMSLDLLEGDPSWLSPEAKSSFGGNITERDAKVIIEKKKAGLPLTEEQAKKAEYVDLVANSFIEKQTITEEVTQPTPEEEAENALRTQAIETVKAKKAINDADIDATLKYDGVQKLGEAVLFQFTIQSGPAKGATITVEEIADLPKLVEKKVEDFTPKPTEEVTAETEPIAKAEQEVAPEEYAFDKMLRDVKEADKKATIDVEKGGVVEETFNTPATTPSWFKQKTIKAYDKKYGTEYADIVNAETVRATINNIKSGKKLTAKQIQVSKYLKEVAGKELGKDPELLAGQEYDKLVNEGFEFKEPETTPVGNIKEGEEVVILDKKGVPDKVTHKGRDKNGDIILQDGVTMFVDEFDTVDVVAEKPTTPDVSTQATESAILETPVIDQAKEQSSKKGPDSIDLQTERQEVENQIKQGKFVPPETLRKYPGLVPEDQVMDKPVRVDEALEGERFDGLVKEAIDETKPATPEKYETTLKDQLKKAEASTYSPITKELANYLSEVIPNSKLDIKVQVDPEARSPMYNYETRTITLKDPERNETALHEVVHAVTVAELENNKQEKLRVNQLFKTVKAEAIKRNFITEADLADIEKIQSSKEFKQRYDQDYFGGMRQVAYAFLNEREFLAQAFSSPEFQGLLKSIPVKKKGWIKNAWDSLVNAVMKVLGVASGKHTAMNEVLESVANLAQTEINEFAQPDNLSLESAGDNIVNMPAFKEWFGDSKVVDENGEPLVVYHGTNDSFDVFDTRGHNQLGSHFTPNEAMASEFATSGKGSVVPAYLSIKKPYDIVSDLGDWSDMEMLEEYLGEENEGPFTDEEFSEFATAQDVQDGLIAKGYDGLKYQNSFEGNTEGGMGDVEQDVYIAFNPTQVKSIYNTTWNPQSPRIDEALEDPIPYSATKGETTEEDFVEHRAERKDIKEDALRGASSVKNEIKRGLDKFLGAISTRLGNINEKLKFKMRRLDYDIGVSSAKYIKRVEPLLRKSKEMNKTDYADWDLARKNSVKWKIDELVEKYDMQEEYEAYREALDEIRQEALDVGYEIGLIEEYAPRVIKDSGGFLEAIGKDRDRAVISERLNDRANELGISVAEMTDEMKADLIANMLFGGPMGKSAPGATKARKIDKIPPELSKYYLDSNSALTSHIHSMVKSIEARKFFGKVPKRISNAKRQMHVAQSNLRRKEKELAQAQSVGDDKKISSLEKSIRNLTSNIMAYRNTLEAFKYERDFTNTIAGYVGELVQGGEIDAQDEQALTDILSARFNERGTHGLVQAYKNLSYIDTMGSPISALTQFGDQAWSWYENGFFKTFKGSAKSLRGKSRINKEDVGIDRIAQEFSDPGKLANAVSKVFKVVGLEKMDSIGKETLLNGAFDKYVKRSNEDMVRLRKELQPIFEGKTESVIESLQNSEITEDTKFLAYSKLLDYQPAALSEMPEQYLKAGNGRIFYMLKSYTLKQFDVFRNISYNKMKNGTKKEKAEGLRDLIKMASLLVLANATADEAKDWVLGRETELNDRVVDNVLRLFGVSKFVTWQARTEGLPTAVFKQILPPFKFGNSLYKDAVTAGDGKGVEMLGSVPVVGKMAYWHIGRGSSKRGDLWDRRFSKEKKKLNEAKDRVERNPQERAKYGKELRRLKKANKLQGKLNKLRSRINKLKAKETKTNKRMIQSLERRREVLIKNFLGD